MSERLGPIVFGTGHDEVFLGRDFAQARNYSENVAAEIDSEIKSLIDSAYEKAKEIISTHLDKLNAVAKFLMEHEKMSGVEFERMFREEPPDPPAAPSAPSPQPVLG